MTRFNFGICAIKRADRTQKQRIEFFFVFMIFYVLTLCGWIINISPR
ncbi:hypothetical protein PTRA_a1294 [Pseudoalteromonas translucida KMM 520]|uniref:Membrane protein n=2 Tax=Pseudoalteromonas translucida TaxID=166935 RepID=Q3IKD6_PSET1|nr:hypothetical protein PTRA_a1294 [Pseudoalteromonas translucida KMM 520]CAI86182.1 putative membrane protein [Pseudoalteromonas translucida]